MRTILNNVFLIVVINPYDGIKYDEINVYSFESEEKIETVEPVKQKQFCFLCEPPQYVEVEPEEYGEKEL